MVETSLKGKKLLILGGAYQHRKLVETAKNLGVETYVTDYLNIEDSPAKAMADHAYMYNITDMDDLERLCRDEKIDGVIAPYLDVTQKPYQQLCERMGWPCFGDKKQHDILTDKKLFKEFCEEHGADVIPYYSEADLLDESACKEKVAFPILVKPCDSRGSRGQTICFNREEALPALEEARAESQSGEIIIEKYMGSENDIQLVYFVVNGEPILVRVEDRYLGEKGTGLDKLCIATIDASIHDSNFREKADEKVRNMIKAIGLKNSPIFIQAFMDGDVARLYDPGIRLPGDDYDVAYKSVTGIDIAEILIRFALTGEVSDEVGERIRQARIDKATAMILPGVRPGIIKEIKGLNEIKKHPAFLEMSQAYKVGEEVGLCNNVKQRFGEFVIECDTFEELRDTIEWMFDTLEVLDENGMNLLFAKFDTKELRKYFKEA